MSTYLVMNADDTLSLCKLETFTYGERKGDDPEVTTLRIFSTKREREALLYLSGQNAPTEYNNSYGMGNSTIIIAEDDFVAKLAKAQAEAAETRKEHSDA